MMTGWLIFGLYNRTRTCTACSGNGKLICCDGCWRAFHLTCWDPPMTSEAAENIEGKWYCYKCKASRSMPLLVDRGVFGELTSELNKKNLLLSIFLQLSEITSTVSRLAMRASTRTLVLPKPTSKFSSPTKYWQHQTDHRIGCAEAMSNFPTISGLKTTRKTQSYAFAVASLP